VLAAIGLHSAMWISRATDIKMVWKTEGTRLEAPIPAD